MFGLSMNYTDDVYAGLINLILCKGENIKTRNSNVKRIIDEKVIFEITPLICARKTAWKNALREWEWFMSGSSCIEDLHPSVRNWWKPWATEDYKVVLFNYSEQFRNYASLHTEDKSFDQIEYLVNGIKEHPYSRRNVITTWNTAEMAHKRNPLTNCHGTVIQAFVDTQDRLQLVTYQRSVDVICGLPHNWIQYWAFLQWLAYQGGRKVGSLRWTGGDIHIYEKHFDLAGRIVEAANKVKSSPNLIYKVLSQSCSDEFLAEDFSLEGEYSPVLEERAEMVI